MLRMMFFGREAEVGGLDEGKGERGGEMFK
jgi:hypothetical protein